MYSDAGDQHVDKNESNNMEFIPSLTLLEFEKTFKKPNLEPPARNSASVKLTNIWQSPYYTCYYKKKCSNIPGDKLHLDVTQVSSVHTIKYEDFF